MAEWAIQVERLSKRYQIGGRVDGRTFSETLTDMLAEPFRRLRRFGRSSHREKDTIWALRDVSFEVEPGEMVGVIGPNGAGKSTLLKILSRITEPTEGRAMITRRVASLLEVGTGFHAELTGRENVYLSGAILGMSKSEIRGKFDEIVDFSGVEKFIDTPVKRYSSGMRVRLGFAVAAHLEPQILLVDEVLAVGDAAFRRKCLGKMDNVVKAGRTVLLVSHNMASIRSLCPRSILLDQGRVVMDGDTGEAIDCYIGRSVQHHQSGMVGLGEHANRLPGMTPVLTHASVRNASLEPCVAFHQGQPVIIDLAYDARALGTPLTGAGITIESANGARVGAYNTYMSSPPPHRLPPKGVVRFHLEGPVFTPGRYLVTVAVSPAPNQLTDKVERVLDFDMLPVDVYGTGWLLKAAHGVVALDCRSTVMSTAPGTAESTDA